MKFAVILLAFALSFSACSKSKDTKVSSNIEKLAGRYSGALNWEKNDNGNKTTGTDDNARFDIDDAGDSKIKVTVNSSAVLSSKTFQMELIGKSENAGVSGYIFQLAENSDVQTNISLRITIMTITTASLNFNISSGGTLIEKYAVDGSPVNN